MKKKYFNYTVQEVIEANLQLQSIQRCLSQDYKIYDPKINTLTGGKFINTYKNWDEKKKFNFIRTIAGAVNFKKVKIFFDQKTQEEKV